MKILIIGGTGAIGSGIAKELIKEKDVNRVQISARHIEKARQLEKELGEKVSVLQLDATEANQLAKAIKGVDVVINCGGPAYKIAIPIVKTVVKEGVNYIDLMDDPDPMMKVLENAELNKAAKKAGITVIVGSGLTPGLSNMLAKYGANKLDKVERIDVSWVFTSVSATGAGAAISEHMFNVMDKGWTYKNRKWVEIQPLVDGKDTQDFLELGKLDVYDIGHPEPIMLPHYVKGVDTVTCKAGMLPPEMLQLYRILSQLRLFGLVPIEVKGGTVMSREFLMKHLAHVPSETWVKLFKLDELEPVFELRVAVAGEKDREKTSYIYNFADVSHETATCIPTALGALLLGRKEVKNKGLFAPEGCLDPDSYIKKVVEKGVVLYETVQGKRELFKP